MSSATDFRTDINGLRAWAVVLVMFYHFGVPGFSGGFVGVDVFLVISGYLMTNIVVGGLVSGRFRLHRFLAARVRRVLPALLALCSSLLILGWFCLNALDYKQLAAEVLYSVGFVSNIQYWNDTGYFNTAAHDKWMLHTWSLSLEMQFYLLFPMFMLVPWLIWRSLTPLRKVIAWGAFFSLAVNVLITPDTPSAAFYLLPTRSWEFFAGGLVALHSGRAISQNYRRLAEASGFVLIMASALLLSSRTSWPGAWALLPVIGATLIIFANNPMSALTSGRVIQWLGTRSYSAYLWHWPLVVLLGYLNGTKNPAAVVAGIAATLFLANLSYRWFERFPIDWLNNGKWLPWMTLAGALLAIGAASLRIDDASGVPGRLPPEVDQMAAESENRHGKPDRCSDSWQGPGTACVYGGDRIAAVLVGDSHALAVASALAMARTDPKSGVLALIYPACITIFSAKMVPGLFIGGQECGPFNRAVREIMETFPPSTPLILMNRTSAYVLGLGVEVGNTPGQPAVYFTEQHEKPDADFLAEFSEELVKSSCELSRRRPVYLVRPIPEMPVDVPKAVARALAMGVTYRPQITLEEYSEHHRTVLQAQDRAAATCGIKLLDPREFLCSAGVCPGIISGRPIFFDDDHLSEYGNKFLVPMFRPVFSDGTAGGGALGVPNGQ